MAPIGRGAALLVPAMALLVVGGAARGDNQPQDGIHKIRHVVVIVQENRSFDSYFGTYPGADGIPPGVCVPDPKNGGCIRPFHDTADVNLGGPHNEFDAHGDIDGGKMDGFVKQREASPAFCNGGVNPNCVSGATNDVMGYHDGSDIANYWAYAKNFVLQDHMFESNLSY